MIKDFEHDVRKYNPQFALLEAVTKLRQVRKSEKTGVMISVSASDPLNLHGVITPGKKVPAYMGNRILYRDGVPVAMQERGEVKYFSEFEGAEKWAIHNSLITRNISPRLRAYLGKGIM